MPDRGPPLVQLALAAAVACSLAGWRPADAAVPTVTRDNLLALRAEGDFEAALEVAEALLAQASGDADLLLIKGQLQGFLGRHAVALDTLGTAAAIAPDYLDIQLAQARVHLYAEAPGAALAVLQPVVTPGLERSDAQLLLGRVALAAGESDLAREAFARAVDIEPAAGDAWLGLGDAAAAGGMIEVAEVNYERALAVPETAPVARERLDALAKESRRFELTTDLSYSRFNNAMDDWREGGVSLGWRIDDRRQVIGSLATVDRFGGIDVQGTLTYTARLNAESGYLLGAALSPGADFLPTWRLRAGFDHRLYDLDDGLDAKGTGLTGLGVGIGFVEGSLADYTDGLVKSFEVGVVQYGWDGRAWLTAKAGGSFGAEGGFDPTLGLRLDVQLLPETRVFAGFGQSIDNGGGGGTTRSYFAGLDQAITDRLSLLANVGLEDRERGVRRTSIGVGFRVSF